MFTDDTIAAISTPLGHGGIGIVRLSGSHSIKIADTIFCSPKKKKLRNTASHRIIFGHIINPKNKEIVDEVLVSIMKSPNTYTREDIVEINCHGGSIPLRRILELALTKGARLAEPGEFTKRAFLNGRIDLAQAEAVLDIINSLTVESQKSAMNQLKGSLSNKIESIRNELIELTAIVEAYIDFPEEDLEPVSIKQMKKSAMKIRKSLMDLIESSRYGIILREGVKTAIVGRPNVGKSSLLNALLDQDRAIVTEVPGTTRDVIEEYLNIKGLPIKIMDTAGIRDVEDIAEQEGVKRSLRAIEDADLVLVIIDGSESLHDSDIEIINNISIPKAILVINKIDLPQKPLSFSSVLINRETVDLSHKTVKVSAKKRNGLDQLRDKIVETALNGKTASGKETVTNVRHVNALERAVSSLDAFVTGINEKFSPEFLSVDLREILDAIGEIQGITTPEDILNRIFSNFCIGK
jgi:tRNA modification GTPase